MSPNKQYTKIFGQDGYMEIGQFFQIFEHEIFGIIYRHLFVN